MTPPSTAPTAAREPAGAAPWTAAPFAAVVCLAPLPFGATALAPAATVLLLLGAACLPLACRLTPTRGQAALLGVLLAAFAAAVALVAWGYAPDAHPVRQAPETESVVRLLAVWTALIGGAACGASRDDGGILPRSLAGTGAVMCLAAVCQNALEPGMLLWADKIYYVGSVSAPFANRNMAASYYAVCMALWLAATLAAMPRHSLRETWRFGLAPGRVAPLLARLAGLAVCFAALAGTGSRAGLLAGLAAAFATATSRPARGGTARRSRKPVLWAGGALALFAAFEMVSGRASSEGFVDAARWEVWKACADLVAASPLRGVGFGGFADAFPPHRPEGVGSFGVWDVAHDSYIEMAVEMGLPAAAALLAACVAACVALLRAAPKGTPMQAGAAGACVAVTLHSCVDFPMQAVGLAVPVMALAGWGLARAFRS